MGKNLTLENKAMEEGKAIVQETAQKGKLTEKGQAFLDAYLYRVSAGKAFARAGQGLRAAKSEETLLFWGEYADETEGFGGALYYKAPAYNETILRERLKILGWTSKKLPSAIAAFARKHKLSLTDFEKAALDQEEASRKAARREEEATIDFPESVLLPLVAELKKEDGIALDKLMIALSKAIRQKLTEEKAK